MAKIPRTIEFIEDGDCMTITLTENAQGRDILEVVFSFTTINIAKCAEGFVVRLGDKELKAGEKHEF